MLAHARTRSGIWRAHRIENDPAELEKFSDSLTDTTDIVIESSSTWYGVYRIFAKRHHVVLLNPGKTKAIASAKVKTDKIDAITLANLLRGGYMAESFVPPPRQWSSGSPSGAGPTWSGRGPS